MAPQFDSYNTPSASPSTKNQFIENLIEIARKDEAVKASQPEIERFVEELFYHISKFNDDDLSQGKITFITKSEIESGEYSVTNEEIPYFNNLIRILNRLFRISRGTL